MNCAIMTVGSMINITKLSGRCGIFEKNKDHLHIGAVYRPARRFKINGRSGDECGKTEFQSRMP